MAENENRFIDPCEAGDLGTTATPTTRQGLIKSLLAKKLEQQNIDPSQIITDIDTTELPSAGSVDPAGAGDNLIPTNQGSTEDFAINPGEPPPRLPDRIPAGTNLDDLNLDNLSAQGLHGWFSSFGKRNWFFYNPNRNGIGYGSRKQYIPHRYTSACSLASYADFNLGSGEYSSVGTITYDGFTSRINEYTTTTITTQDSVTKYQRPMASTMRYTYNHNHYIKEYRYIGVVRTIDNRAKRLFGNPLHAPGYFRNTKTDSLRYISGKHYSYFPGGDGVKANFTNRTIEDGSSGLKAIMGQVNENVVRAYSAELRVDNPEESAEKIQSSPHFFFIPDGIQWINRSSQLLPDTSANTANGTYGYGGGYDFMGDNPQDFDIQQGVARKVGLVMNHGWKRDYYDIGHVPTARDGEEFITGVDELTGHETLAWWLTEWRHENLLLNDSNWQDGFDSAARKEIACIECYPHHTGGEEHEAGENIYGTHPRTRLIRVPYRPYNNEVNSYHNIVETNLDLFIAQDMRSLFTDGTQVQLLYPGAPNPVALFDPVLGREGDRSQTGALSGYVEPAMIQEHNIDAVIVNAAAEKQTQNDYDYHTLSGLRNFYKQLNYMDGTYGLNNQTAQGTFLTHMRANWSWKNYFYGLYPTIGKRWYNIHGLRNYLSEKSARLSRRSANPKEETNRHPSDLAMMHGYRVLDRDRRREGFGYVREVFNRGSLPPLLLDHIGNETGQIEEGGQLRDIDIRDLSIMHFSDFKHGSKERFSENMFPIIPFYGPEYYPDEVAATSRQVRDIGFTADTYRRGDGASGDFLQARDRDKVYQLNSDNDCIHKRALEAARDSGDMSETISTIIFQDVVDYGFLGGNFEGKEFATSLQPYLRSLMAHRDGLAFHPHIWEIVYEMYVQYRDNDAAFLEEYIIFLSAMNIVAYRIGEPRGQVDLNNEDFPFITSGYSYGVGSEVDLEANFSTPETRRINNYVKEFNPFLSNRVRPPTVGPAVFIDLTTSIEGFAKKNDIEKVDYGINSFFNATGEYEYYDENWENVLSSQKEHLELTNLYQNHPTGYSIVGGSLRHGGMEIEIPSTQAARGRRSEARYLKEETNRAKRSPYLLPPSPTPEVEIYDSVVLSDKRYSEKYKLRKTTPMYIDIQFKPKVSSKASNFFMLGNDFGVDYSSVAFNSMENVIRESNDTAYNRGVVAGSNYRVDGNYAVTVDSIMYYDISNKSGNGYLVDNYTEEEYSEMLFQTRERYRLETQMASSVDYEAAGQVGEGESFSEVYSDQYIGGFGYQFLGYDVDTDTYGKVPAYKLNGLSRPTQIQTPTPILSLSDWLSALEEDARGAASLDERINKVFGQAVLTSNLDRFVGEKFRSYQDIMKGKPAHTEIIGYKVKKLLKQADGQYTLIQTKYFAQVPRSEIINHFDSQVKYGEMYKLEIYSVCMIVGNKYAYLDPMTSQAVQDFNQLASMDHGVKQASYYQAYKDGTEAWDLGSFPMTALYQGRNSVQIDMVLNGVLDRRADIVSSDLEDASYGEPLYRVFVDGQDMGEDQRLKVVNMNQLIAGRGSELFMDHARMYVGILNKPHVAITEIFDQSINVAIADKPPVPPNVEVISYKGVKSIVSFMLNGATGEMHAKPVILDDNDEEQFRLTGENQGISPVNLRFNDDSSYQSLDENCLMHFKNDDYTDVFEVFRITEKPKSWSDFRNQKIARIGNGTNSTKYVDTIIPNRKYWYTFRSEDVHGHVSMPSNIYQIEMVSDGEMSYLKQELFTFEEVTKKTKKHIGRVLKISLSNLQKSFNVAAAAEQDWNYESWSSGGKRIGISNNPIWNKKFLIKIKSKDTGREVDLRLKFNRKHGSVDEEGNVTLEKI